MSESQCCGGGDCATNIKDKPLELLPHEPPKFTDPKPIKGIEFVTLNLVAINGIMWGLSDNQYDWPKIALEKLTGMTIYSFEPMGSIRLPAATC